jgi:hypothetical protein
MLRADLPTALPDSFNKNVLPSSHFLLQFQQSNQCNSFKQQSSMARIITSPKASRCLRLERQLRKVVKEKIEEQSQSNLSQLAVS